MCGLAGVLTSESVEPQELVRMADAIRHRGPDGEGYLLGALDGSLAVHHSRDELARDELQSRAVVGLAHRRLSIIDLTEASSQPMVGDPPDLAIAYNGELYNYVELREELGALGHRFRTTGDTEVVLRAYREWGAGCVERMVGMWALAIADLRRRELFLAVDRFGIKPLFHAVSGQSFYFASEIKALATVPGLRLEPSERAVRRFLSIARVDETAETFFDGIERLEPGHTLTVPMERPAAHPAPRRYWAIPSAEQRIGVAEAADALAERLTESVRIHVRSDVDVGTCLSGGVDSSAIVCLADRLRAEGAVPHYAHAGFGYLPEDPAFSERHYMEAVVEQTGIDMTFVEVSAERFQAQLVDIVRQQDEPFASTSQAAQWFVFESAAHAGLKVMLDGQGADEVLGGYDGFFPSIALGHLHSGRLGPYRRLQRSHRERFGRPAIPLRQMLGSYIPPALLRRVRGAPQMTVLPMLSASLAGRVEPADYATPTFRSINEILGAYTARMSLPALLRYEDRNSMAHSIEARVPFLDHRLVELAFSLPGDYKLRGVDTKQVLRDALAGVIPEKIRTRKDKLAFRAEPTVTWKLAQQNVDALAQNRNDYEEAWFDPDGVRAFVTAGPSTQDAEFTLWRVLNTKLWLRTFWDGGADPLARG
jgi:asparagine synthase (glutamine-hydrolysing)